MFKGRVSFHTNLKKNTEILFRRCPIFLHYVIKGRSLSSLLCDGSFFFIFINMHVELWNKHKWKWKQIQSYLTMKFEKKDVIITWIFHILLSFEDNSFFKLKLILFFLSKLSKIHLENWVQRLNSFCFLEQLLVIKKNPHGQD